MPYSIPRMTQKRSSHEDVKQEKFSSNLVPLATISFNHIAPSKHVVGRFRSRDNYTAPRLAILGFSRTLSLLFLASMLLLLLQLPPAVDSRIFLPRRIMLGEVAAAKISNNKIGKFLRLKPTTTGLRLAQLEKTIAQDQARIASKPVTGDTGNREQRSKQLWTLASALAILIKSNENESISREPGVVLVPKLIESKPVKLVLQSLLATDNS